MFKKILVSSPLGMKNKIEGYSINSSIKNKHKIIFIIRNRVLLSLFS